MSERLSISLIFSNLVEIKTLSSNPRMYSLYTKFVKILEICKQFSENLVNESGNVPRRGPVSNILTTYRPDSGHQELCENNEWFVCQNHWQN